jgi:hypothetical protein
MKRLAKDAIADIGNTYRSVLLQDTGWPVPGMSPEAQDFYMTQQRSEDLSKESVAKDIEPTPQPEPDRG